MNQMLYVVLAIILLSSVLISYYSNVLEYTESGRATMYRLQAERIADKYFQQAEAKIDNGSLEFDRIDNTYNNKTFVEKINDVTYTTKIKVKKCNELGDISSPKNDFFRMDIWVVATYGDNNSLEIGTQNNAMKRLFANVGF